MIYINGYEIISAIGENLEQNIDAIKEERTNISKINTLKDRENLYYKIKDLKQEDFFDILEKTIVSALKMADIDNSEDIALFTGTSSINIALNEDIYNKTSEILQDANIKTINLTLKKRLGIKGFETIISSTCSSSSNALLQAKNMIECGLIDKAIVVGYELFNQLCFAGFDTFMLLSPKKIKPFCQDRDGTILGEAVSAIVISKKKSKFCISGGATRVDTTNITSSKPDGSKIAHIIKDSLKNANIKNQEIIAIKAHAAGTFQSDEIEAKAIHAVFDLLPPVFTLKPFIGHTMGGCGLNELVLFIGCLNEGFIPKSLNYCDEKNDCDIYPTNKQLVAKNGSYLLNYFGFGGNNSCLILNFNKEL